MLGEATRTTTPRIRQLQDVLDGAGFTTKISANIDGWMLGHTAFVVPIGLALFRVGTDAARLTADPDTVGLMVRATREAFRVLVSTGNAEIPPTFGCSISIYRRLSSSDIGDGYWLILAMNSGSARTAGPPAKRYAFWLTSSRRPSVASANQLRTQQPAFRSRTS